MGPRCCRAVADESDGLGWSINGEHEVLPIRTLSALVM
jgi:hypothetical protein